MYIIIYICMYLLNTYIYICLTERERERDGHIGHIHAIYFWEGKRCGFAIVIWLGAYY